MRKLDYKFRSARFQFLLLLFFSAFAMAAGEVEAQEIQELDVYMRANNFSSSDHFSDLLYGGNGIVEIIDGQISEPNNTNPQTLSLYVSEQGQLQAALQKFPSIEFIRLNVEDSSVAKVSANLLQAEALKFILFVIPDSFDPSRLETMVTELQVNSKVLILYQISRPG